MGNLGQRGKQGLLGGLLLLYLLLGAGPAIADIQVTPDIEGQVLYQARQQVSDQRGYTWTAIAFKFTGPGGDTPLQLRLVGFPGTVHLDHQADLSLSTSRGDTYPVANTSDLVSKTHPTEPHVGQYRLQPVLLALGETVLIDLKVPTVSGPPIQLPISPAMLHEWQTVVACSETWCGP